MLLLTVFELLSIIFELRSMFTSLPAFATSMLPTRTLVSRVGDVLTSTRAVDDTVSNFFINSDSWVSSAACFSSCFLRVCANRISMPRVSPLRGAILQYFRIWRYIDMSVANDRPQNLHRGPFFFSSGISSLSMINAQGVFLLRCVLSLLGCGNTFSHFEHVLSAISILVESVTDQLGVVLSRNCLIVYINIGICLLQIKYTYSGHVCFNAYSK